MIRNSITSLTLSALTQVVIAAGAPSMAQAATGFGADAATCESEPEATAAAIGTQREIAIAIGAQNNAIARPADPLLEEYLELHAQATQDDIRATLMPWPGLRSHAN